MSESRSHDSPLLITKLLSQTIYRNSPSQVVFGKNRETWKELNERAMRLAYGLRSYGIGKGSKVAVVDFDTHNYLESYYAIPATQAVLHTVNIRLPPEQIALTMAHAEDRAVLVRDEYVPLLSKLMPHVKTLKNVVVMSESGSMPSGSPAGAVFYDDLLSNSDRNFQPEDFDENSPATLFYTSGTTGAPKGVWFTHRQLVLHALSATIGLASSQSPVKLESRDVILPLVPMFHVHGWGFPYISGMLGQKYVIVGKYDPGRILENISSERATWSHMVPTILNMIINHPSVESHREALSHWKVVVGGSALPSELARKAGSFGIKVMSGYGLSETAPILTLGVPGERDFDLPPDEMLEKSLLKTGLPIPLVDLRIVDSEMNDVPRNAKTIGEIVVRSPWATKEYFKDPELTSELWENGWLHTKDLATIDENGYVKIADRTKDAIKSGGEWISTIDLEDILMRHPSVLEAAVIGDPDEEWGERPVAIVTKKSGKELIESDLIIHLQGYVRSGHIAKFWIPDRYIITEEPLPKTSTGKIDKKPLREKHSRSKAIT
jgi:fatty-acyl-CoA synthase